MCIRDRACAASLMFASMGASGIVFGGRDMDLLFSLPVSAFSVMLSKLLALYLENLIFNVFLLIPAGVIYLVYGGGGGVLFCMALMISTLFLSCLLYTSRFEACIAELRDRGIEADIIVMHPYDRWGFSAMSREEDDLYWKYVVARFAAYRNVWWSLANEYDLLRAKTLEDWERYASILCEKDPYNHLRSVHNCIDFYDYTRPWITHCSMQRQDLYRHVEYTDDYQMCIRDRVYPRSG